MKALLWIVAVLLLVAAAMLIGGVGNPVLWSGLVAVGVALVIIDGVRSHHA
jgi:hypothetical protein